MEKRKKILVIKNDKIGDMVLSANIFRALRKNFPRAEITAIVSNANKSIIEQNKNIDKYFVLDYPPKGFKGIFNYFKFSRELKKENYDVGIDLRGSIFNIFFLLRLAGVKYEIGFYNRKLSKIFLDYGYEKDRDNKHVTFQRIDLINKALKLKSKDYWPEIAVGKEDEEIAEEFIRQNRLKKYVCIVPDASLESKQWPLERFDAIIKHIQKKYSKYKIVLLGANKEKISWLVERNKGLVIPAELLNLRINYLLFKKSTLVIAHDGGPMHLAWVAKANLIALMPKHLSLNYYGPLGENSIVISDNIKKIRVDRVQSYVDLFLGKIH